MSSKHRETELHQKEEMREGTGIWDIFDPSTLEAVACLGNDKRRLLGKKRKKNNYAVMLNRLLILVSDKRKRRTRVGSDPET